MANFDNFIDSLRLEFGESVAGKKFEHICKWYLETDPEWSKIVDTVWLWDEYPNKWQRQDLGTDLVFRDRSGLIWAVQTKCYSQQHSTKKADINSFLADTSRQEVDRRLWMQTTNKMAGNAEKTLAGQEKPVTILRLDDFRAAQLDYPDSFGDLYQSTPKQKPQPEPHQIEAITAVEAAFGSSDRGQLIMACGTGKTFTTLWIKEALGSQSTLVLLPSLSLLSQTMREWAWAANDNFEILNICSDQTVGRVSEDMSVTDAPFPVTSDITEIKAFLCKPGPKVVFCTYQSSPLLAEAQFDQTVPAFDLAIADEAHRCAGKVEAGFATILKPDAIRAGQRLFTTATPRYFGNAVMSKAEGRGSEVIGMDNEAIFGSVIHQLTFGESINRGLLTDYQVVIVGVNEPMVKAWIDSKELLALNTDLHTDARSLAAKIGLIKAIKDYDLERVISFHNRVSSAREFTGEFNDIAHLIRPEDKPSGVFFNDFVSGQMSAEERKQKIDRLKALEGYDRGILANARCLAEGVDVPSLDGVAFIDPRGSQVEIIQAVGRAIRKVRGAKTQKKGTIVLPVFVEEGDNPEAIIEASNFKPVWDVLKALRAHDEILSESIDAYRCDLGRGVTRPADIDKLVMDLPINLPPSFASALKTRLVECCSDSWEFWYGLLESFKEREGHVIVPSDHMTDTGHRLGRWVGTQRRLLETLNPERKKRLDELGFVWNALDEKWKRGVHELTIFFEHHGHSMVPDSHVTEDGFDLGTWVRGTRTRIASLSVERKKQLDALGFSWNPNDEKWELGISELKLYKDEFGDTLVPALHRTKTDFPLGRWVSHQRKQRLKQKLPAEQIKRLDELGFVWDVLAEQWEVGYSELCVFYEENGHALVPTKYVSPTKFRLGSWVAIQRRSKRKGTLTPEQIKRLDKLGFVWGALKDRWDSGFIALRDFKAEQGHLFVPSDYKTKSGFCLGVLGTSPQTVA